MPCSSFKLILGGQSADDALYTALAPIEVEENADLAGAMQIRVPIGTDGKGDFPILKDARFGPFANLAVVVKVDGGKAECIFDGYVLSHKAHLETGSAEGMLQVWASDASHLMNLTEKTRAWPDVTDASAANTIFGEYGITPARGNNDDDSPVHAEDGHILMQRGTDIQFLRQLARRSGKLCRVTCTDTPGIRTGTFARPSLDGDPKARLTLNAPKEAWAVDKLDFSWDVMRPTKVTARQATRGDSSSDGTGGDTTDSGLKPLDARSLSDFAGRETATLLAAAVDDAGELTQRSKALLGDAGWFVKCEGEADLAKLGVVLRVGTIVSVESAGSLYSGKYFVWSVRHTIARDSHKMRFTLVRNGIGK